MSVELKGLRQEGFRQDKKTQIEKLTYVNPNVSSPCYLKFIALTHENKSMMDSNRKGYPQAV